MDRLNRYGISAIICEMKILVIAFALAVHSAFGANAWMQNARKSPEWFTRGVMYQIQIRAFTPEGTLAAAKEKLPYLKDLGVTIAYLVPVMKMDSDMDKSFWSPRQIKSGFENPKNQYRIADYFHVDEEYGTDQDLKGFCAEAHRLGLKVVLDLVYLHCGPTAPFLKEHPEFTWWNDDGSVKKGPWRFPKLNFSEPGLRAYFMDNMKCLIEDFGADGFRCDVGDGIPLDFWCDAHDMMDRLTGGDAILLCEGFTVCDQYKGFDADYGWFPGIDWGLDAVKMRSEWEGRERQCPAGSRFVNHYENHDIATDIRPRFEAKWGHAAVDQILVWMFTMDGVPMLFNGNEIADADERHSMFGKTPMDWSQLDKEPGKSRHALVRRLAMMRRENRVFTDVSGKDGLTWLDTTAKDYVSAFVRRNGRDTVLVVQNWTDKPVSCEVSFSVPKIKTASYLASDETDRAVKGAAVAEPILVRDAVYSPDEGFSFGPFGWWISEVASSAECAFLTPRVVQSCPGYNSWPMVQAVGNRLVCAYSRGSAHTVNEGRRGVFARVSKDCGATWSDEVCVCNMPEWGEVTVGKGLDDADAMLLWIRRVDKRGWGDGTFHDLWRTTDGVSWKKVASPELNPHPIQITDIITIPGKGLMSLWFAGSYGKGTGHAWGTLTSADGGRTWTQKTVEEGLEKSEWPTEQSAVHLGGGRILGMARCESGGNCQFQLTSTDGGETWTRERTNIGDVKESTPSLVYDAKTKTVFNYYYQRGAKKLKCRRANADFVFDHPMEWPGPIILFEGKEERVHDAGNVNATALGGRHFLSLYTGTKTDTAVLVIEGGR